MGYSSTLEYVAAAAKAVLNETGLLPHINAGVMTSHEMHALRAVSVSQGLMLESLSPKLLTQGGAHYDCPDKEPRLRLEMLETAGKCRVPFTTGILIGIGETHLDRIEALLAIKESHSRYGHIQEVIIQNFRAKKGTAMANFPEPPLEELLWSIAAARLILGPYVSIQAPPNLTPESDDAKPSQHNHQRGEERNSQNSAAPEYSSWQRLINAGINDWGGVSPLTRDYVNPERPWPHVLSLAAATAASGKNLVPRLPIYPSHISEEWLESKNISNNLGSVVINNSPFAAVLKNADVHGLARASRWYPGAADTTETNDISEITDSMSNSTTEESNEERRVVSAQEGLTSTSTSTSLHGDSSLLDLEAKRRAVALPKQKSSRQQAFSSDNTSQQNRPWRIEVGPDGLLKGSLSSAEPSPHIESLLSTLLGSQNTKIGSQNNTITEDEIELLFSARGADFSAITRAADDLRRRINGDTVTYVVNRNINYTNICTFGCKFCAFSKGPASEEFRGAPYLLPLEEVTRRAAEGWARGATEVCMQGGIHPEFTGDTYLELLAAAKKGAPDIHVHAFSPLEVSQGAATLGWSLSRYLKALKDAGLGSLPGTAAEVLDDAVRAELCPDKLSTNEWLEVVETAHFVGLNTTSTIMFGHVDSVGSWARHLLALRDVARRSQKNQSGGGGGITEFVPLPFVHMEAPMFRRGKSRAGPTFRECVLMHAIARLVLHPYITNIQASWVKMGPERAAELLAAGCNDMGGTLMNESITKAAGAAHGQEVGPLEMEELIRAAGRIPKQRTTLYKGAPEKQTAASMQADPLMSLN